MAAAPMLQVLEVSEVVTCDWDTAQRLMSSGLLRLKSLFVYCDPHNDGLGGLARIGPLADALSDVSLQQAVRHAHSVPQTLQSHK